MGTEKVKQKGANGRKTETYMTKMLNGKIISTTVISRDTYDAMQKIILRGTKGATTEQKTENTNTNNEKTNNTANNEQTTSTIENKTEETKNETQPKTDNTNAQTPTN